MSLCSCGSGLNSWWENDARGIPLACVCEDCKSDKLKGFRPEVLSDPNYETDEAIEPEDEDEESENDLQQHLDDLMEAFDVFDRALKTHDRHTWERWKAGGKAVSNEFISMYPSAEECL